VCVAHAAVLERTALLHHLVQGGHAPRLGNAIKSTGNNRRRCYPLTDNHRLRSFEASEYTVIAGLIKRWLRPLPSCTVVAGNNEPGRQIVVLRRIAAGEQHAGPEAGVVEDYDDVPARQLLRRGQQLGR